MTMDIWNNEYVRYRDDMREHIVTFGTNDPICNDWEYDFAVTEKGKDKILMVEDESLLYQIKALSPIEGKTVSIKAFCAPGETGYVVAEVK